MTRPTEPTDLGALTALLDGATPGEWIAANEKTGRRSVAFVGVAAMRGQGEAGCIAVLAGGGDLWRTRNTDAALIVALRNAAPGLIAEVAELRRKVAAVERVVNEPEPSVGADGPDDLESVYVTGYNGALILVRAALETA